MALFALPDRYRNAWAAWWSQFPERDAAWGQKVFKIPTGFTEHFRGWYYLWQARFHSVHADPGGAGAKSRRLGFRALGRIASAEQMLPIQRALERIFNSPEAERYEFRGRLAMIALQRANEVAPEVMDLLTDDVLAAVRQYYRSNFSLYNVGVWRNFHVPVIGLGEEPLSNNWHTDSRRIDMLKVFVLASDADERNGPTHVLTREWSRQVVLKGFKHRRDYHIPVEVIENPGHLVRLTGPAGTALLCNTNLCFHRASIPAEGRQRDLIEFRFVASPKMCLTLPDEAQLPKRDRVYS